MATLCDSEMLGGRGSRHLTRCAKICSPSVIICMRLRCLRPTLGKHAVFSSPPSLARFSQLNCPSSRPDIECSLFHAMCDDIRLPFKNQKKKENSHLHTPTHVRTEIRCPNWECCFMDHLVVVGFIRLLLLLFIIPRGVWDVPPLLFSAQVPPFLYSQPPGGSLFMLLMNLFSRFLFFPLKILPLENHRPGGEGDS